MPHFCCVVGCAKKSNKYPTLSYHAIPKIPSRGAESRIKLISERRALWLSRIARAKTSNPAFWKVCGNHFLTGAPADLKDVDNPDWAPNLNLGHSTFLSNGRKSMASMERYERASRRHTEVATFEGASSLFKLAKQSDNSQEINTHDPELVIVNTYRKVKEEDSSEPQEMFSHQEDDPLSTRSSPALRLSPGSPKNAQLNGDEVQPISYSELTIKEELEIKEEDIDNLTTEGNTMFVMDGLNHWYVPPEVMDPPVKTMNFATSGFHRKATIPRRWVSPPVGEDSDLEEEAKSDVDNRDLDPFYVAEEDMTPTTSGHVTRIRPEEMPLDDDEDEKVSGNTPPPTKKAKMAKDQPSRVWKKEDIGHTPLPKYNHPVPDFLLKPYEFFLQMLTIEMLEDIVHQTNLYAWQKDVSTVFFLDIQDLMVFVGIILYMGVVHMPSLDDYWAVNTRIPQVTDYMSAKRFKQLRSTIHFNNNNNAKASTDRFFKIRPLFTGITKQFLRVKETPQQLVDEVMVAYEGTMAGNLRQYIANKPDKFGYKLFCRASIDGFIHDVLIYQGETTFSSHPVDLNEEEEEQLLSNKIVIALAKTIKDPANSAIYADDYFTSIQLVEFLKDKLQCRYVGTARPNRIGNPPLISGKEMETTPRGNHDYVSCNGVLAMCWKDDKPVTILSSDAGVLPLSNAKWWDKESNKKVDIPCPAVIKEYSNKMGGIDKSNMLTNLYKSPMTDRRWYLRLFGYILDLCTTNAWILYKRDSKALSEKPMPLKNFRLEISAYARGFKTRPARSLHHTTESFVRPKKGQKTHRPADNVRYDYSKFHCPISVKQRMTCKHCSTHKEMHRSRWVCKVCQVALCHSETRNCFEEFHIPPASNSPSTSASPSRPSMSFTSASPS